MDDQGLQFPNVPRSELESTIEELIERAQRVLVAQGRLRSLLTANRLVVESLDLEGVLRHIAEAAVHLVDAQYGALGVIAAEGHLERFIHVGMPPDVAEQIGHLPEGHGLLGAVIESGSPIRLEDLGSDPRSAGFPAHHPPMLSFLGVPIRVRDESYGNLYLTNPARGTFTREDEELVTALAATAGIAIENARLYEEARRRQRMSTALSDVTNALLAPDAGDVLDVVAERVGSLTDADLVTIVVPTASGRLRVETARGVGAHAVEGALLPEGESIIARAIAGGQIVISLDHLGGLPFGDQLVGGSTVAVPLVVSGAAVGALCVTRRAGRAAFSVVDQSTIADFAGQAGLAVALAWARADRQRLALVEDRARIARDLHDNVIQRLFGTGLGLQALAAADPAHADRLDTHIAEIDEAIADIRTAVFTLRTRSSSESVRHRVLAVATELTPGLRTSPRVTFDGPLDLVLTGRIGDDVVAVVRETLSNVARHAQADMVVVNITVARGDVTVTVDDDGIGVPDRLPRASGTVNLDERARARGGTFTLGSLPTGGSRACWHVPLISPGPEPA